MSNQILARAIALGMLGLSTPVMAITTSENNASIPFSFTTPGARSLAMGGAFVGAADDATAALSNPAGLVRLGDQQQASAEFRINDYEVPFAAGGEATFDPFDNSGIDYDEASNAVNDLSYLSWVLPRDRWALALYRHSMVNYENSYTTGLTFFDGGDSFVLPYHSEAELDVVAYGASFGYSINDTLAVGAGIAYFDFEINTSSTRFDPLARAGGFLAPEQIYVDSQVIGVQVQRGDDHDIAFNFGLLYRGSDNFSIGLNYRSAPKFDYRYQNIAGPRTFSNVTGISDVLTGQLLANDTTYLKAPDVFGIGFNWRPTERLSINFDVNRINYRNLTDQVVSAFFNPADNPLTVVTQRPFTVGNQTVPAGTVLPVGGGATLDGSPELLNAISGVNVFEQRLGIEYVIDSLKHPLSLRAGTWREELHTLQFEGDAEFFARNFPDVARDAGASQILFSAGDDEIHWSAGLGWAFETFQVDFAFDTSDIQTTASVSGVYRF